MTKSSYVALGYTCNHTCIMCPLSDADRVSEPYDVHTVLQGIRAMDLQPGDSVTVSGGEPTLVGHLPNVLLELAQRGVRITILTNGTGFADMDCAQRTLDDIPTKLVRAVLAIHSATPEVHDGFTGCVGSHATTLRALDNLSAMGVHVCVKIILNRLTVGELEGIAHLFRERLSPQNSTVLVTSTDYAGRAGQNSSQLFVTFPKIRRQIETFLDALLDDQDTQYHVVLDEMPLCSVDPYYWSLFAEVPFEAELPMERSSQDADEEIIDFYLAPNASEEGVPQSGITSQYGRQRACAACDVAFACGGVWSSAYEIGGKGLVRPIKAQWV